MVRPQGGHLSHMGHEVTASMADGKWLWQRGLWQRGLWRECDQDAYAHARTRMTPQHVRVVRGA